MKLSQRQRVIVNNEQKSIRIVVVAGLRVCHGNHLKKQRKNAERLSYWPYPYWNTENMKFLPTF